jgi:hypothetical protein
MSLPGTTVFAATRVASGFGRVVLPEITVMVLPFTATTSLTCVAYVPAASRL